MAHDQPWSSTNSGSPTVLDASTIFPYPPDLKFQANTLSPTRILIRDPPRNQLSAPEADLFGDAFFVTRFPGKSNAVPTAELYITPSNKELSLNIGDSSLVPRSTRRQEVKMAKKRRSLQSIFTPLFLTAPPSPTSPDSIAPFTTDPYVARMRSYSYAEETTHSHPTTSHTTSPRASPPPDFLIDDDPFANLSSIPSNSSSRLTLPVLQTPDAPPPKPRSPLTPSTPENRPNVLSSPKSTSTMPVGISRALSGRARPAYQKPAFAPRPSLPSLDTLARMNVVLTKKVRKGRVGAGLPFEPWDDPNTSGGSSSSQSSSSSSVLLPSQIMSVGTADFVADLELNFLDFSDDEEDESGPSRGTLAGGASSEHTSSASQRDAGVHMSPPESPPESRTASSEFSLTRSTSLTSNSSTDSSDAYHWPSYNSMSSTESDSDVLNSPPDDYFTFPTSRYSSSVFTSMHWESEFYDSPTFNDNPRETLFSDVNFLGEPEPSYEPGTSAGTIRPSMESKSGAGLPTASGEQTLGDKMVDGGGWEDRQGNYNNQRSFDGSGQGHSKTHGRSNGSNSGNFTGDSWRGLGGRGDDDDDDDKRRANRSTFSTPSDSENSTSDEADSTDDYGDPAEPPHGVFGSSSVSDDDVPLAQRIPTALSAQRTIRRQVREERDQRRKERAMRTEQSTSTRSRQTTLRPTTADSLHRPIMSSSQEAALHASKSTKRPRTRTLPAAEMRPFTPEDLAKRLQTIDVTEANERRLRAASTTRRSGEPDRPQSAGRSLRDPMPAQHMFSPSQSPAPETTRPLRPARSFHRPEGRKLDDHRSVPMPVDAEQKLGRSLTRIRPREDSVGSHGASPRSFPAHTSSDDAMSKSLPRRSGEESRKLTKIHPESKSTRTSLEFERPSRPSLQRPPVPPLPPIDAQHNSPQAASRGSVTQQRIFIGDMQRFNMVEIGPSTNARDVIDMVEAQGSLKGWVGSGGWMVWEIAQDFGMERPIRSFELLSDVQASWNKDKMMNTFIIKLTPLAAILSRSAMPTASPTYAGYVEWESKRGKWNKRWLQLREHSLWLSKRDNGRDEVLLCSLSNFDAYHITRLYKSPRSFSFAVKSTDNLSFFENTADYLHVFSCGDKEGAIWMEKILLARSYVLHQERHVLFNPRVANGNAAGGSGALSRTGTRKGPPRPSQPLVAVSPPFTGAQTHTSDVFEPGSLLHKQI